jgi:hypothetical protein
LSSAWPVCKNGHGVGAAALFPPEIVVEIKALACQLTRDEIAHQAIARGIVASIQRHDGVALAQ